MSINSDDPEDEIEEERRLCYVGITRAKELLTLTAASERMIRGQIEPHPVSRFVREISRDQLDQGKKAPTKNSIGLSKYFASLAIVSKLGTGSAPSLDFSHASHLDFHIDIADSLISVALQTAEVVVLRSESNAKYFLYKFLTPFLINGWLKLHTCDTIHLGDNNCNISVVKFSRVV
jgi:DNA helicase-2/ATP-dependent DNA helicase PcrA